MKCVVGLVLIPFITFIATHTRTRRHRSVSFWNSLLSEYDEIVVWGWRAPCKLIGNVAGANNSSVNAEEFLVDEAISLRKSQHNLTDYPWSWLIK